MSLKHACHIFRLAAAEETNPFALPDASQDEINKLKKYQTRGQKLPDSFWSAFIDMCSRLQVSPEEMAKVIRSESGFDHAAVARGRDGHPIAKGFNGMLKFTEKILKMPEGLWDRYETIGGEAQLPWIEKLMKMKGVKGLSAVDIYAKNFGGHNNPDGSLYASRAYIDKHPMSEKFPDKDRQDFQYKMNAGMDMDKDGAITKEDLKRFMSR